MNGRLITLEGGEGAGKSTLVQGLHAHLLEHEIDVVLAREPGGTALGEAVRRIVLDTGRVDICPESELLLMFTARAQLVREVIAPSLARGQWVLCDRFTDASFAYQGGGRGQPIKRIADLERWAADGLHPDLTLLLDLPVNQGQARASIRKGHPDRIESETGPGFFERVRAAYLRRAADEPQRFCVIDAARPATEVLQAATAALAPLLRQGKRA